MNETKSLTAQEQKVYELVSKGLSNKAVGTELGITEKTVKFHLTKVYKKTGLTRYQLIATNQLVSQGVVEVEIQPGLGKTEVSPA